MCNTKHSSFVSFSLSLNVFLILPILILGNIYKERPPHSDVYVLSKILLYHFLLLTAWKLYMFYTSTYSIYLGFFFLLLNMLSAALLFVFKNKTWMFLFNSSVRNSVFLLFSLIFLLLSTLRKSYSMFKSL